MSEPQRAGPFRALPLGLSLQLSACGVRAPRQAEPAHDPPRLLFVQAAHGVSFADGRLTLRGVSPTTLFFSDRPKRIAGHVLTQRFLADWDKGDDSFGKDPPNAPLSAPGRHAVEAPVLELSSPRLRGDDLVYDARILSGTP